MMTPLEKAVKAAHECGYEGCEGPYVAPFNTDDARAIITAFLEAAADDADAVGKADNAFWHTIDRHEPPKALRGLPAKAAILALKETING